MIGVEGYIANHDQENFYGTVVVDEKTGLIIDVLTKKEMKNLAQHIKVPPDAVIYPGFIDIHTHAREDESGQQNYKETYQTIAHEALKGGLTCIAVMPNTPNPLITKQQFNWHRDRIDQIPPPKPNILNYVAIAPQMKAFEEKHIYKMYVGETVGSLFFKSPDQIRESLKNFRQQHISFHLEDYEILKQNEHQPTHKLRRPKSSILKALDYILPMIDEFQIKATFCHWSTGKESMNKILQLRKKNNTAYPKIEVSPTHLLFDDKFLQANPKLAAFLQVNPALQNENDRLDLIEYLNKGYIDILATDHAPHLVEEKLKAYQTFNDIYPGLDIVQIYKKIHLKQPQLAEKTAQLKGTSGIAWVGCFYLAIALLKDKYGLSDQKIAKIAAYEPAQNIRHCLNTNYPHVNFGKGMGKIEPGYYGSLSIINYGKQYTLKSATLTPKSKWMPLGDTTNRAKLAFVMVGGKIFYP